MCIRDRYRAVERRYLRSVDGFVFNSRTTQRAVESLVGDGRRHVLAYPGGDRFAPPAADESAAQIAARAKAAGAYVAAAHPSWYALSEVDLVNLGDVDAIEIFNGTAVDHNDHSDSWPITDVMLGRGKRYLACATDAVSYTHLDVYKRQDRLF